MGAFERTATPLDLFDQGVEALVARGDPALQEVEGVALLLLESLGQHVVA
jgi:hypothetical protein